jgi:hypothetical protein
MEKLLFLASVWYKMLTQVDLQLYKWMKRKTGSILLEKSLPSKTPEASKLSARCFHLATFPFTLGIFWTSCPVWTIEARNRSISFLTIVLNSWSQQARPLQISEWRGAIYWLDSQGPGFNQTAWNLERKVFCKQNKPNAKIETETLKMSAAPRDHLQLTKIHGQWQQITSSRHSEIYPAETGGEGKSTKTPGTNESTGRGRPPPIALISEANVISLRRELQCHKHGVLVLEHCNQNADNN